MHLLFWKKRYSVSIFVRIQDKGMTQTLNSLRDEFFNGKKEWLEKANTKLEENAPGPLYVFVQVF